MKPSPTMRMVLRLLLCIVRDLSRLRGVPDLVSNTIAPTPVAHRG